MCGACASFPENMPFGCFDVTKTCTCNLPLLAEQGCSANEECADLDATCRFVDRELQPSIGFTKCASCQTKRVCLLTPGRASGFCACGLADLELQRCVSQSKPAMPAYDKLCMYTQDYSFLRTTSFVFSFYTRMTAPCNDLNPATTYCARESSDGQLYAVGVDAVQGRRLLGIGPILEPMTASDTHNILCKDALSGDAMPAHRTACLAAHTHSAETLALLDLPWPLPPCTFCSLEDAVQGLLLQPQNLVMLASNASRVAHVVLRHSPLRVLAQSARHVRRQLSTAVQIAAAEPALEFEHANGTWIVIALVDSPSVDMLARLLEVALWAFPPGAPDDEEALEVQNETSASNARRLLSIDDVTEAIEQHFRVSAKLRQAFATQLATALDFAFESPLSQREWLGSWPPKLGAAVLQSDLCPPLTNMLRTTRRALDTVDSAYSMQKQATPAEDVRDTWINISRRTETNVTWAAYSVSRPGRDPITAAALFAADRALALAGLTPTSIFDVLAAGADELWYFIRCDYEALQTCSKWRAHVLVTSLVVAVYYVGAYIVCAAIGLAMPALFAAAALPPIVMYMSYGYAPLCFPAVPVCLYDDLVYSLQQLLPKSVSLPSVLYKSEQCLAAAGPRVDAACVRTCTDEPFSFIEWYDVLAWWALELGLEARLADLSQHALAAVLLGPQTQDDILEAVAFHTRVFETPDTALIAANRACAVLSLYKIVPHLALAFLAVMIALASVQLLQQTANIAFQTTMALFISAFY